ncbi:MAG TPA: TIGR03663 family protein [Methanoregulaceae archaeon]|nr:MAG: TIGR03663 family protein [Methanolinea sp.]HPD10241.1 TIGR03663 family protein [Methanoregulaceae archaeon]
MPAGFQSRIRTWFSFRNLFLIIFLLALLLRFSVLDLKLFHHDEAVHAWFAWNLMTDGSYAYDPMYHGPFLYYVTAGMFSLFGDSDIVARILPSLFGAAIIPVVYWIHTLGYLDERQTLVASLFVAVSPSLVYFSRFLRHDIFQLFFTVLILAAILAYLERGRLRYALLTGLAIGCGMSLKEDMPIFLVLLTIFALASIFRKKIRLPETWLRDTVAGLIVTIGIMVVLYSSFGMHPEIIQTGWIRAYEHWVAMHGMCRICGPWFFYILLFLLYEVPIFLLAIFGTAQFAVRHCPLHFLGTRVGRAGKVGLETVVDPSAEVITPQQAQRASWDKKELFFLFCIFWMLSSMAAYAYIGEKVPWLIIHQLLPMIFVSVYLMTPRKTVIAVISCLFLIVMTCHVCFIPADINEPIVQVQNSEDMRTVMALIDASDTVVIASENYWPLPWYYRGERWERMRFYGKIIDEPLVYQIDPDMVITHDLNSYAALEGFNKTTYKISYWFSIYDNEHRIPEYYFKRDGKLGSINIDVFTKPGLFEKAGIPPPLV